MNIEENSLFDRWDDFWCLGGCPEDMEHYYKQALEDFADDNFTERYGPAGYEVDQAAADSEEFFSSNRKEVLNAIYCFVNYIGEEMDTEEKKTAFMIGYEASAQINLEYINLKEEQYYNEQVERDFELDRWQLA